MPQPDLTSKPASPSTADANRAVGEQPWLADGADSGRARRGRIALPASPQVLRADSWPVWDLDAYATISAEPPPSVNPSLWRQAILNGEAGLFEVAPGFHQVRGLDLSNLTVIEGEVGRILIDPLSSAETARAALDLVEAHLGPRPVTAVIYTHSHIDHFGGVRGVIDDEDVTSGRVRVIAPSGFLAAAVSENVIAGTVMRRRATYMYGALLPKGARGHVDSGLGKGIPLLGHDGLIGPTEEISETGTELVVDGVRIVFQITPDTEAPAEMNFHFPDHRVLCMAENCTCTLHNLYTPRGAQVRDALAWSTYIGEAIELFGATTDACFASHHWPRWGSDDVLAHLRNQRDTYRFIHDQTMRLANHGHTMIEIAEELRLPPGLEAESSSRGYYGTVNHNAKAVYQRYLGWFDGNPAHLHPLAPTDAGAHYVEFMGGAEELLRRARLSFDAGEYRWVAQVVDHLVFADPDNFDARALQADALEQLGYQSESGPWRDFYLTAAQELRQGPPTFGTSGWAPGADTVAAMTTGMLFEYLGVRIDGLAAARRRFAFDVEVRDSGERWALGIENGALHSVVGRPADRPDAAITATHAALAALVTSAATLAEIEATGDLVVTGDRASVEALLAVLDTFPLMFPIVTP